MGSLVTAVQTAYNTWKTSKDVTSMNESELSQYNIVDIKFQKMLADATEVETAFYEARDEAFATLESNYQTARVALATSAQSCEDNNFTIPSGGF